MRTRAREFWRGAAVALLAIGLAAAGCSTTPSEDQKPKKVEPTGPHAALLKLFPGVGDVTDWKAAGDAKVYGPAPAEGVEPLTADPGASGVLVQGYGYTKSATRKYVRGTGAETVTVRIFEMTGPQDAYGVFSVSSSGQQFPNVGLAARMSTSAISFAKGSYFATIEYAGINQASPVLMEFARAIADQIPAPGYRPAILESFPLQSVEGERYYLHTFATLGALPFVPKSDPAGMARALALGPTTDVAVMGYPTGKPGTFNYLFVIHYMNDADAQAAYKAYFESYLAQSTNRAEHNTAVAPPVHGYLAGTFNAEENSVNDQLAKLLAGLGG
jgi:hypothetical protein